MNLIEKRENKIKVEYCKNFKNHFDAHNFFYGQINEIASIDFFSFYKFNAKLMQIHEINFVWILGLLFKKSIFSLCNRTNELRFLPTNLKWNQTQSILPFDFKLRNEAVKNSNSVFIWPFNFKSIIFSILFIYNTTDCLSEKTISSRLIYQKISSEKLHKISFIGSKNVRPFVSLMQPEKERNSAFFPPIGILSCASQIDVDFYRKKTFGAVLNTIFVAICFVIFIWIKHLLILLHKASEAVNIYWQFRHCALNIRFGY